MGRHLFENLIYKLWEILYIFSGSIFSQNYYVLQSLCYKRNELFFDRVLMDMLLVLVISMLLTTFILCESLRQVLLHISCDLLFLGNSQVEKLLFLERNHLVLSYVIWRYIHRSTHSSIIYIYFSHISFQKGLQFL